MTGFGVQENKNGINIWELNSTCSMERNPEKLF
jgi:hypothetical protein